MQEKLKDVFKDTNLSRNTYYFLWEVDGVYLNNYIEKYFQTQSESAKKTKNPAIFSDLSKAKEMIISSLLTIDPIHHAL